MYARQNMFENNRFLHSHWQMAVRPDCSQVARQTTVDLSSYDHRICFDYPLAYLKYLNWYEMSTYLPAYVKYARQ
jgi:hypothetical protein